MNAIDLRSDLSEVRPDYTVDFGASGFIYFYLIIAGLTLFSF